MTSYRILHADDDPDIREIVALSLGQEPTFEVTSCASGEDVLTMSDYNAPDIVICDVMMPGMGGPEVLALLRQNPRTRRFRLSS